MGFNNFTVFTYLSFILYCYLFNYWYINTIDVFFFILLLCYSLFCCDTAHFSVVGLLKDNFIHQFTLVLYTETWAVSWVCCGSVGLSPVPCYGVGVLQCCLHPHSHSQGDCFSTPSWHTKRSLQQLLHNTLWWSLSWQKWHWLLLLDSYFISMTIFKCIKLLLVVVHDMCFKGVFIKQRNKWINAMYNINCDHIHILYMRTHRRTCIDSFYCALPLRYSKVITQMLMQRHPVC